MITLPYLVRVLEPEAYGQMSFVAALITNFVIFVEYGFYVSGAGQIAKLRSSGQAQACALVIQDVYAAKFLLFLASFGAAVVLTLALPKVGAHWDLVAIGFLSVAGQWLLPQWVLLGLEQMRLLTLVTVLPRVLMVLGAVGPAVSMVAAELVVVAGLFWVLKGALVDKRGDLVI